MSVQMHDFVRDTRVTISLFARGELHRVNAYNEVSKREVSAYTYDIDAADVLADYLLELVGSKRKG